ncbi:hypothetical protein GF312_04130, partial [Candidatus Poribacteria bacterium]|nr:hypothetical protein [Candidatus Poribacteria bacterium]
THTDTSGISYITFSPDGSLLCGAGSKIRVWDMISYQEIAIISKQSGHNIRYITFSPDGNLLASADFGNGTVLLWDMTPYYTQINNISLSYDLPATWNLVSMPLQIGYNHPANILSSIQGMFDSVWTYEPDKGWLAYRPGLPGNLNKMLPSRSFWIRMNQTGTLDLLGSPLETKNILLKGGVWNFVGYDFLEPKYVEDFTDSAPDSICIYTYDAKTNKWLRYIKNAPDFLNTLNLLEPGKGYLIWVDFDHTLIVSP